MEGGSGQWGWCDAAGITGTRPCSFPFIFEGMTYNDCTTAKHSKSWCSIETDDKKEHKGGAWGECPIDKKKERTGRFVQQGSRPCVFPFEYKGYKYTSCTTARTNSGSWCAIHDQSMEGGSGQWGWCDAAGITGTRPCSFPFIFEGITYNDCTTAKHSKSWCSIETDDKKEHKGGAWGECPIDKKK